MFDLIESYFGDGETDLSRLFVVYLEEDWQLARAFLQGYLSQTTPHPGFARRVPGWWDGQRTFRDWASRSTSLEGML